MTDHLGGARLTAASPPRGPGKTLLGDEALPVGCLMKTIVWTVLGHRLHGDKRVYSVPRFHPGIDLSIGHPSRNEKMPVYRAPCIYSPIHRDTTTSMARGPSAKPPHPSFFGKAKRRTSSKSQYEGRYKIYIEYQLIVILWLIYYLKLIS